MASPQARQRARYAFGLLKYIPDGEYVDVSEQAEDAKVTSWESFIRSKAQSSARPFRYSFEVSNLGPLDFAPDSKVRDFAWCQRPSAGSCCFVVDVCGAASSGAQGAHALPDLVVVVGWHADSIGIELEQRFTDALQGVLRVLVAEASEDSAAPSSHSAAPLTIKTIVEHAKSVMP